MVSLVFMCSQFDGGKLCWKMQAKHMIKYCFLMFLFFNFFFLNRAFLSHWAVISWEKRLEKICRCKSKNKI